MPNFSAALRTSVRDVQGLVLSCGRNDVVQDDAHPGFMLRWRNRAPGLPSKPFHRVPSDPVTYPGGRFSDPRQDLTALQPAIVLTGGGQRRVSFDRALGQHLRFTIPGTFPEVSGPATVAYQFEKRPDTSNDQIILDDQQSKLILRRRGAGGLAQAKFGAVTATAAGDHDNGTFVAWGGTAVTWHKNGAAYASAAGANNSQVIIGTGLIGIGTGGAGTELDGILDCLHIWYRELSPLERDFVWQVLNEDLVNYATQLRAPVALRRWTDATGNLALGQINRVRAVVGGEPLFKLATVGAGGATALRVQIAAAVDGKVLPDSALGGELFTLAWVEAPGNPAVYPVVSQDAGWSAVFDCALKTPGHYCAKVERQLGGAVFLHFDVEVVA